MTKEKQLQTPVKRDPRWQHIGASLRKNVLFVKMTQARAHSLILSLQQALFLWGKAAKLNTEQLSLADVEKDEKQATALYFLRFLEFIMGEYGKVDHTNSVKPVILQLKSEFAELDCTYLDQLVTYDSQLHSISRYIGAIRKGLASDPSVDWIKRVQLLNKGT